MANIQYFIIGKDGKKIQLPLLLASIGKAFQAAASHISNMDSVEITSHYNKIAGFYFQDNEAPF